MRTLVTGAAGFIGFHLCRRLSSLGDEVMGTDSINDYYDPSLKYARLAELGFDRPSCDSVLTAKSSKLRGLSFRRLALQDRSGVEELFRRNRFDRVCHMAAQAGVRYSIENPHAYVESNIVGFLNVLEGCRAHHIDHLVFASSSSVYGLSRRVPFSPRESSDHPMSLYAATKKADEAMAHAYSHLYSLPVTGLRFFTVYGPWGRPDMAYYKFALAIAEGQTIKLYNNGEMLRDFTYIDDVIEGVARVLDKPATPQPGWDPAHPDPSGSSSPYRIYNIGNSRPEPLSALVECLEAALGRKAKKELFPMQPGDVYATEADVSGLLRDFSWAPSTSLKDGIARFADWFSAYHGAGRS
ncbi:MAG: NAD-dependent epimerase [Spirochaetia bacterium]|jgi:UDP-glucuronate 4-epimerase